MADSVDTDTVGARKGRLVTIVLIVCCLVGLIATFFGYRWFAHRTDDVLKKVDTVQATVDAKISRVDYYKNFDGDAFLAASDTVLHRVTDLENTLSSGGTISDDDLAYLRTLFGARDVNLGYRSSGDNQYAGGEAWMTGGVHWEGYRSQSVTPGQSTFVWFGTRDSHIVAVAKAFYIKDGTSGDGTLSALTVYPVGEPASSTLIDTLAHLDSVDAGDSARYWFDRLKQDYTGEGPSVIN